MKPHKKVKLQGSPINILVWKNDFTRDDGSINTTYSYSIDYGSYKDKETQEWKQKKNADIVGLMVLRELINKVIQTSTMTLKEKEEEQQPEPKFPSDPSQIQDDIPF